MTTIQWIIVLAIGCYIVTKIYDKFEQSASGADRHCLTCGIEALPIRVTRGHFAIEVILWCCFIMPGLIYSIWRLSTRHTACPSCGATLLVPVQSPAAVAQRKVLGQ